VHVVSDDARKKIFARRARFVAAALVAAGMVSRERESEGQQTAAPAPSTSSSEMGPAICLSDDPMPEEDAGPPPAVCLSVVERKRPGCGC
jgi:hypothetical protein